jgi:hypothetical protein
VKRIVLVIAVVILTVILTGCPTAPKDVPDDLRPDMKNPQRVGSGRSSAETNTNDMPLNTGVAWGASQVDQTSTTAKYQPTASTSGTGSLVTGFQLGAVSEVNQKARDFVASTIKGDPVLKNLSDELKYLMDEVEYGPEWQARADALRTALAARSSQIYEDLTTAGLSSDVNLASLTHIVVVGFITSNVGHDERAPTDAEIEAVARVLPNIVSASRGEETEKKPDGN